MTEKHFTIDVEENTQENALFEDDKFVCFEGDNDEYLKKINEMSNEIEQLKSELFETKEVLKSIERDRNQTLLVCKKYEGFFKEKGYDIHDLIDYARDGGND